VKIEQPVEKVFFLSLRAKRGNLAFNKINGLEIRDCFGAETAPRNDMRRVFQQPVKTRPWRVLLVIFSLRPSSPFR
jgi:hypothetical protein